MSNDQRMALICAVADLIGAIQVEDQQDPMVRFDTDAARQSIEDLIKAFPLYAEEIQQMLNAYDEGRPE